MDGFRGNRLSHTAPKWNTVRLCPQGTKDLCRVRRGLQTDGDRDLRGREREETMSSVLLSLPLPPPSLRIPPQPLSLLPPPSHRSGKGRGPWPHPSSVTLTSLSLFKLPPLPPLVQNVIFWPQGCQGGDQGWSRDGGWCWSSFGIK